jgi:ATP adenylyltransferase
MKDKLWAPWRSKYIHLKERKKCIFCGNRRPKNDASKYIVDRSRHSFSILNIYPYNNGHIMVAPFRHCADISELSADELDDLMELVRISKGRLDKTFKPHGYNIGMNIGRAAGAGFDGHIHIHIVPRWSGDTNFMPVLSGPKIVSDSLDSAYRLLKRC